MKDKTRQTTLNEWGLHADGTRQTKLTEWGMTVEKVSIKSNKCRNHGTRWSSRRTSIWLSSYIR